MSFHNTVALVRSESLTNLPSEEKNKIWYRSSDYSRFVHSELGRRKEMGVTSTSLIMPSDIAHHEPSEEDPVEDDDVQMDDWTSGFFHRDGDCDSSDDDASDDDDARARGRPVRVVG